MTESQGQNDAQDRDEAERNAELARQNLQADSDLREVMMTVEGRRVIHRQLETAGIWRSTFTGNALTSAFNEGGRNQGLMLLNELTRICPAAYTRMLAEHHKDAVND